MQVIAERLGLPLDQVETTLAALESQPTVTREAVLRRIVEAWLEGQRQAYRSGPPTDLHGEEPR